MEKTKAGVKAPPESVQCAISYRMNGEAPSGPDAGTGTNRRCYADIKVLTDLIRHSELETQPSPPLCETLESARPARK